jgi:hypothetical protein
MIPVFKMPMGKGEVAILTSAVGGAMSNTTNKNLTDVYTDTWPDGITVDINLEDFTRVWLTCLCCELEELEGEMEFIISDASKEVH